MSSIPKSRKTLLLQTTSGTDNFKVVETEVPAVNKLDVVIHVKFCGLNFAECSMKQGLYNSMPPLPGVIGYECSGTVLAVGDGVTTLQPGDPVIAMGNMGIWQEVLVLPEKQCFKIPDSLSLKEAAALPVNYVTSSIMLFDQACLKEGQSVLIHMAAGGVGTAVGQLCKTMPDVTVFGTASSHKHEYCKTNGITHPVDYRNKDYVTEIKAISPKGVDIVLDPLGGSESTRSHSLLKPLGKHIHFGMSTLISGSSRSLLNILYQLFMNPKYSVMQLMSPGTMVGGLHVGELVKDPDNMQIIRRHMKYLVKLAEDKKIRPVIDSVWSFEQVADAMNVIYERKNMGKVLLTPDQSLARMSVRPSS